jgi:RNA polymerase sigma-70 factor (ECF subfamily)
MVRNRELAEDLSQEVFLKAYKALGSYDSSRKFSSWLFKVAHNATIDYLRRGQLATVPLSAGEGEDRGGLEDVLEDRSVVQPDRVAASSDVAEALELAMQELRPAYREVILLRHREELPYQEIADITGSSLGTVKTNLHRARKELAARLKALGVTDAER